MSNITKNHKVGIFAIFLASALMLGTISVTGIDSAFANESEQEIEQESDNRQDGQCVGAATLPIVPAGNCNQVGVSVNLQFGSQSAAQD